jgi:SAM-dependent methyltransferase
MFMNPRFTPEYLEQLYGDGYYTGKADYTYYDERADEKYSAYVWDSRIRKIKKFRSTGNFLDIGCSFGGFMKRASACFTAYGIDLSGYASSKAAASFPGRVHTGTIHDLPFSGVKFSVITMIELLEHESDPVKALNECCKLLDKGGLLVIQTANFNALQAAMLKERYAYFMPGHLSYFSSANLKKALMEAGFSRVKIYYPVEFGLLPKLLKSRMNFKSIFDYRSWIRISLYHLAGKIRFKDRAVMSSMVVYALK